MKVMTHTQRTRLARRDRLLPARWVLACTCCWLLVALNGAAQDLTGLYLTWQRDPTTTMTINWVNLYPRHTMTVYWRAVGTEEWREATATQSTAGPSSLQIRRVELTGLQPATTYEFGIGRRVEKPTDGWRFRTMPSSLETGIHFVAGGDMMHRRSWMEQMSAIAAKLDPDFALFGGDLAYANGELATRWVDWHGAWMERGMAGDRRLIPIVVAIGNHEVRGGYHGKIPDDAPYFYSFFQLPEDRSYYALDFGNYLSLIVLDTDHTQPIAGAQTEWLQRTLAARTNQQFLFACYHYPAYGTTKSPEDGTPLDAKRAIAVREHWVPFFERYGVTALLEHDHHNYKRTHRILHHQRDDEHGLLYLGDGAWGVETRTVPDPADAWWLARAEPRRHLWHIALAADGGAALRAIDADGAVFDEVVLDQPRTAPVEPAQR